MITKHRLRKKYLINYILLSSLSILLLTGCAKRDTTSAAYDFSIPREIQAMTDNRETSCILSTDSSEGTYKVMEPISLLGLSSLYRIALYSKDDVLVWENMIQAAESFSPVEILALPNGNCIVAGYQFNKFKYPYKESVDFSSSVLSIFIYDNSGTLISNTSLDDYLYSSYGSDICLSYNKDGKAILLADIDSYNEVYTAKDIMKQVHNDYSTLIDDYSYYEVEEDLSYSEYLNQIGFYYNEFTAKTIALFELDDNGSVINEKFLTNTKNLVYYEKTFCKYLDGFLVYTSYDTADTLSITYYDTDLNPVWIYEPKLEDNWIKDTSDDDYGYSISVSILDNTRLMIRVSNNLSTYFGSNRIDIVDSDGQLVTSDMILGSQDYLCEKQHPSTKTGVVKDKVFWIMDENLNFSTPIIEVGAFEIRYADFYEDYFTIIYYDNDYSRFIKGYNYDGYCLWKKTLREDYYH